DQQRLSEALMVTRGISVIFGWLALAGIYLGGLALWHDRRWALFGALIFGFSPPILQVFAIVTNDAAVIAFSALLIAASLHLCTNQNWKNPRLLLFTAVVIALAGLSKVSGLVIAPIPVLAVLWGGWRERGCGFRSTDFRSTVISLVLLMGLPLIFAGGWYLRNYLLYGDLLGTLPHRWMGWSFDELQSIPAVLTRLPIILQTLWFNAGWGEIRPPAWGYLLPICMMILAVIGWIRRPRFDMRVVLLVITLLLGVGALIHWMQMENMITGRLYLPYIPALVLLMVWGIKQVPLAQLWRMLLAGAAGGLAIITTVVVIFPALDAPALINEPPANLQGSPINFGVAIFLGYQIDNDILVPGQDRQIKLCWQAPGGDTPIAVPYPFALQVIQVADRNRVQPGEPIVASRESYPGLGKYTLWQPGKVFCDEFRLPPGGEKPLKAGREYALYLTLYDPVTLVGLPGYTGDQLSSKIIGYVRAAKF
ncbi:MAG TPA: phospholipid carrier-dependent glycosyltransferase, partial [Phototrophicaceae bacterium]|nr:phospholipid carrier-dependent glycosyltransferase [Phototrophicaceae bacterium]